MPEEHKRTGASHYDKNFYGGAGLVDRVGR